MNSLCDTILNLDLKLFLFLNGLNVPGFVYTFFTVITGVNFLLVIALLLIVTVLVKFKKKGIIIVVLLLLGTGIGDFSGAKIKRAAMVKRPSDKRIALEGKFLIGRKSSPSFPSNHALNWGYVSMFLFLVLKSKNSMRHFRVALLVFGVLVAYSRVAVGVHYPMDISFGYLYGVLLALLFNKFYQTKFNT